MGWRDINMNRRRPQPRVAFVADVPGGDRTQAVLCKAAASAVRCAAGQLGKEQAEGADGLGPFVAGYVLGHARVMALRDGVDCEAIGMGDLAKALAGALPAQWGIDPGRIVFRQVGASDAAARTGLQAAMEGAEDLAGAGYLAGHLEAACGSEKLLRQACERLAVGGADAGSAFLTDCDVAADPMQTRNPTLLLRFHGEERDVIRRAFVEQRKP